MVSQEKWDKTKRLIAELEEMVALDCLPLTKLLQIRGFLMYVVRTYPWINPFMKGLHLTIDSWWPFRGPDGFKLRGKELASVLTWDIDKGQGHAVPKSGGRPRHHPGSRECTQTRGQG